jgi:hypothetical protein
MSKKCKEDERGWDKAINTDKNYITKKNGYKYMLDDIEDAKVHLSKFKRGLSIFVDPTLRAQLRSTTAAPVLSKQELKSNMQKLLLGETEIMS